MCESWNWPFTTREHWCFCDTYEPRCSWTCDPSVSMGCSCSQLLFGVIDTGDPIHLILSIIIVVFTVCIIWKAAQWWKHRRDHRKAENAKSLLARHAINLA